MEQLRGHFGPVVGEPVALIEVDEPLCWRAVGLRARHYHRSRSPLSLADCVALAAVGPDDAIATADQPLVRAARAEGLAVIALAEAPR